jgi:hypothetical protein
VETPLASAPAGGVARRPSGLAAWVLTGAAGLAGFALMRVWVPAEGRENAFCLMRRVLGIPCPGCGMTRAFAHLAKGEWSAALADHPLAPALALELGLLWMAWGAVLAGRPVFAGRRSSWVAPLAIGNLAVLWALWLGRVATGTLPW